MLMVNVFVKNNKKTIDIYPVDEHICKAGNQGKIIKTYRIKGCYNSPILDINIKKNYNIKIDINYCPFCGKKL